MDDQQFLECGKDVLQFIAEYRRNLSSTNVMSLAKPNFLLEDLPDSPPEDNEEWNKVFSDFKTKIVPGMTHWQHPSFHGYASTGESYASICGVMLINGLGCLGYSWATSPSIVELEIIVTDWLGKAIGLPSNFIYSSKRGFGRGIIQGSDDECILMSMAAARDQALRYLKPFYPNSNKVEILGKLVAYCSEEANSGMEKAARMCMVHLQVLDTDPDGCLRGYTLQKALEQDEKKGLFPFFVGVTLGSLNSCAFDKLEEIGQVCKQYDEVWVHVDASYAGCTFMCPEMRDYSKGMNFVNSININPSYWMNVGTECSILWYQNVEQMFSSVGFNPKGRNLPTLFQPMHSIMPLNKKFRALKLWMVLKLYGLQELRKSISHRIDLAKTFRSLLIQDRRFEEMNFFPIGMVCFRLKGCDRLNQFLLSEINMSGKLFMTPVTIKERFTLQFIVTNIVTMEEIQKSWKTISSMATLHLEKQASNKLCWPESNEDLSVVYSFTTFLSHESLLNALQRKPLVKFRESTIMAEKETDNLVSESKIPSRSSVFSYSPWRNITKYALYKNTLYEDHYGE